MTRRNLSNHRMRLWVIGVFFLALGSILLWRMVDLTVLHRSFLQGQGNARSLRVVSIPANRGMILDREGVPLAVSTPVQSLWVNPKTFHPTSYQLSRLARLLDIAPKHLKHLLHKAQNHEFYYLHRQLPPARAKDVADLKIPGTNFQEEYKRFYPEADSTAQLIGFTNVDDIGIEGLELQAKYKIHVRRMVNSQVTSIRPSRHILYTRKKRKALTANRVDPTSWQSFWQRWTHGARKS